MARDYKYRAEGRRAASRRQNYGRQQSVGLWKWMLITALIIAFVVFLVYLRSSAPRQAPTAHISQTLPAPGSATPAAAKKQAPRQGKKIEPELGPKPPQFDFYTILPEKEVVVPDYEIKTRAREERIGKAKDSRYIMQAGSFKKFKEADQLKARLALMGIESKIEKAKVGNVTWSRVKLGPYARMSSVSTLRARLRQNGIDVVVTEKSEQ
ncbi:Sporulation related protein [Candidatus Methylobacter favarea]|uniref:Sporulation related protein n=1 Tax=Candidatus Methylobacter favarea TaxID=2707345 RepID=A0A8S0YB06_9GAMM|nr:SPOR domain-containing protein [Candidatus Methylobacter favarea]CAA9892907.1 Sporulation related protein [Candidatus Methylobacter favarea]